MSTAVLNHSRSRPTGDYLPELQTGFGDLGQTGIATRIRKFLRDCGEPFQRRECFSGQLDDGAEKRCRQRQKAFTALVAAVIESCRTEIQTDSTRSRQISRLGLLSLAPTTLIAPPMECSPAQEPVSIQWSS